MEKKWNFKGKEYIMRNAIGYDYQELKNKYILNGYYCTESYIWNNIDNVEDLKKQIRAKHMAEGFVNIEDYYKNITVEEKKWKYRNRQYTLKKLNSDYQYQLNGYYCSGLIWDYIHSDEPEKQKTGKQLAESFIRKVKG